MSIQYSRNTLSPIAAFGAIFPVQGALPPGDGHPINEKGGQMPPMIRAGFDMTDMTPFAAGLRVD